MSERSFAVWSVGLALVFAVVVPEPGRKTPPTTPAEITLEQPAITLDEPAMAIPPPAAAPVRVSALAPPAQFTVERAPGVEPERRKPILWAVHATP